MNNPVNDFPFSIDKTFVDDIPLGILHLLYDNLLCRLCSNSSKGCCVHLSPYAVSQLTPRVKLTPLFQLNFQVRFGDLFNHLFELKGLNLAQFFIVPDFDIYFGSKSLPGSRPECFFKCLDENFLVNAPVTTDLFNDFSYFRH